MQTERQFQECRKKKTYYKMQWLSQTITYIIGQLTKLCQLHNLKGEQDEKIKGEKNTYECRNKKKEKLVTLTK